MLTCHVEEDKVEQNNTSTLFYKPQTLHNSKGAHKTVYENIWGTTLNLWEFMHIQWGIKNIFILRIQIIIKNCICKEVFLLILINN